VIFRGHITVKKIRLSRTTFMMMKKVAGVERGRDLPRLSETSVMTSTGLSQS
jgi:hypothetical protein